MEHSEGGEILKRPIQVENVEIKASLQVYNCNGILSNGGHYENSQIDVSRSNEENNLLCHAVKEAQEFFVFTEERSMNFGNISKEREIIDACDPEKETKYICGSDKSAMVSNSSEKEIETSIKEISIKEMCEKNPIFADENYEVNYCKNEKERADIPKTSFSRKRDECKSSRSENIPDYVLNEKKNCDDETEVLGNGAKSYSVQKGMKEDKKDEMSLINAAISFDVKTNKLQLTPENIILKGKENKEVTFPGDKNGIVLSKGILNTAIKRKRKNIANETNISKKRQFCEITTLGEKEDTSECRDEKIPSPCEKMNYDSEKCLKSIEKTVTFKESKICEITALEVKADKVDTSESKEEKFLTSCEKMDYDSEKSLKSIDNTDLSKQSKICGITMLEVKVETSVIKEEKNPSSSEEIDYDSEKCINSIEETGVSKESKICEITAFEVKANKVDTSESTEDKFLNSFEKMDYDSEKCLKSIDKTDLSKQSKICETTTLEIKVDTSEIKEKKSPGTSEKNDNDSEKSVKSMEETDISKESKIYEIKTCEGKANTSESKEEKIPSTCENMNYDSEKCLKPTDKADLSKQSKICEITTLEMKVDTSETKEEKILSTCDKIDYDSEKYLKSIDKTDKSKESNISEKPALGVKVNANKSKETEIPSSCEKMDYDSEKCLKSRDELQKDEIKDFSYAKEFAYLYETPIPRLCKNIMPDTNLKSCNIRYDLAIARNKRRFLHQKQQGLLRNCVTIEDRKREACKPEEEKRIDSERQTSEAKTLALTITQVSITILKFLQKKPPNQRKIAKIFKHFLLLPSTPISVVYCPHFVQIAAFCRGYKNFAPLLRSIADMCFRKCQSMFPVPLGFDFESVYKSQVQLFAPDNLDYMDDISLDLSDKSDMSDIEEYFTELIY